MIGLLCRCNFADHSERTTSGLAPRAQILSRSGASPAMKSQDLEMAREAADGEEVDEMTGPASRAALLATDTCDNPPARRQDRRFMAGLRKR